MDTKELIRRATFRGRTDMVPLFVLYFFLNLKTWPMFVSISATVVALAWLGGLSLYYRRHPLA